MLIGIFSKFHAEMASWVRIAVFGNGLPIFHEKSVEYGHIVVPFHAGMESARYFSTDRRTKKFDAIDSTISSGSSA